MLQLKFEIAAVKSCLYLRCPCKLEKLKFKASVEGKATGCSYCGYVTFYIDEYRGFSEQDR
jgi:hypothetical protein